LDRVQNAAHFEVSEVEGLQLMAEIAKQLPGYALPEYVREVAGEPHKVVIS
jgi:L-lysine 2,3-aminomutase